MANPTINWATRVITIPQSFLTPLGGSNYGLDTDAFRLVLKDIEDTEGIGFPDTHRHNTQVVLGGITYARFIEIINNYTVTFENGSYAVSLTGSNNNILDVLNLNSVSVRSSNSAGLVSVATLADDLTWIAKVIKNKKELKKVSNTWYLVVYDDDGVTELVNKALKDLNDNEIDDLDTGVLAKEGASSV